MATFNTPVRVQGLSLGSLLLGVAGLALFW